jgi:hypothetical protein
MRGSDHCVGTLPDLWRVCDGLSQQLSCWLNSAEILDSIYIIWLDRIQAVGIPQRLMSSLAVRHSIYSWHVPRLHAQLVNAASHRQFCGMLPGPPPPVPTASCSDEALPAQPLPRASHAALLTPCCHIRPRGRCRTWLHALVGWVRP